jgi:endonuclease/exonuclease/phosphatase family metal-dependent hydrolase
MQGHGTRLASLLLVAAMLCGCPPPGGDGEDGGGHDGGDEPTGDAEGDRDGEPRDRAPVRVMTWNLENFPLAAGSIDAVASIILESDADVVGVQELSDQGAFETLVGALPGYDGLLADDADAFYRAGIVYRADRIAVIDTKLLFENESYAFPRPVLKATVRARGGDGATDFDFTFLVLHLKAQVDAESESRRRAACSRLHEWMATELQTTPEQDIVAVGDWNDELTDAPADNVFQALLDRPQIYTFLTMPLAEQGAVSYLPYDRLIDHVLVTASALEDYGQGQTAVLEPDRTVVNYRGVVSDHRPVLATFDLP